MSNTKKFITLDNLATFKEKLEQKLATVVNVNELPTENIDPTKFYRLINETSAEDSTDYKLYSLAQLYTQKGAVEEQSYYDQFLALTDNLGLVQDEDFFIFPMSYKELVESESPDPYNHYFVLADAVKIIKAYLIDQMSVDDTQVDVTFISFADKDDPQNEFESLQEELRNSAFNKPAQIYICYSGQDNVFDFDNGTRTSYYSNLGVITAYWQEEEEIDANHYSVNAMDFDSFLPNNNLPEWFQFITGGTEGRINDSILEVEDNGDPIVDQYEDWFQNRTDDCWADHIIFTKTIPGEITTTSEIYYYENDSWQKLGSNITVNSTETSGSGEITEIKVPWFEELNGHEEPEGSGNWTPNTYITHICTFTKNSLFAKEGAGEFAYPHWLDNERFYEKANLSSLQLKNEYKLLSDRIVYKDLLDLDQVELTLEEQALANEQSEAYDNFNNYLSETYKDGGSIYDSDYFILGSHLYLYGASSGWDFPQLISLTDVIAYENGEISLEDIHILDRDERENSETNAWEIHYVPMILQEVFDLGWSTAKECESDLQECLKEHFSVDTPEEQGLKNLIEIAKTKSINTAELKNIKIGDTIYTINAESISYLTEAPTKDNEPGKLTYVMLDEEPEEKFDGYIYIINSEDEEGSSSLDGTHVEANVEIPEGIGELIDIKVPCAVEPNDWQAETVPTYEDSEVSQAIHNKFSVKATDEHILSAICWLDDPEMGIAEIPVSQAIEGVLPNEYLDLFNGILSGHKLYSYNAKNLQAVFQNNEETEAFYFELTNNVYVVTLAGQDQNEFFLNAADVIDYKDGKLAIKDIRCLCDMNNMTHNDQFLLITFGDFVKLFDAYQALMNSEDPQAVIENFDENDLNDLILSNFAKSVPEIIYYFKDYFGADYDEGQVDQNLEINILNNIKIGDNKVFKVEPRGIIPVEKLPTKNINETMLYKASTPIYENITKRKIWCCAKLDDYDNQVLPEMRSTYTELGLVEDTDYFVCDYITTGELGNYQNYYIIADLEKLLKAQLIAQNNYEASEVDIEMLDLSDSPNISEIENLADSLLSEMPDTYKSRIRFCYLGNNTLEDTNKGDTSNILVINASSAYIAPEVGAAHWESDYGILTLSVFLSNFDTTGFTLINNNPENIKELEVAADETLGDTFVDWYQNREDGGWADHFILKSTTQEETGTTSELFYYDNNKWNAIGGSSATEQEEVSELEIKRLLRTEYSINFNISEGTESYSISGDKTIWERETAEVQILISVGNSAIEEGSISVKNAEASIEYDKDGNALITLSNPTDEVIISASIYGLE